MATHASVMDSGEITDWLEAHPINQAMRRQVTECAHTRLDMIGIDLGTRGAEVKMLDYACGNGFYSRVFTPYMTSIEAVDVSAVMVDKYNARIDELGSTHTGTQAVVGDVLADPPQSVLESERYHDFHLITVGAALHHFADTGAAVERLARRLRPGGVLYIQDMLNTGQGGEEGAKARGFTFNELESLMSNARLVNSKFEALPDPFEIEVPHVGVLKIQCFIASGMKKQLS